jgi:hypothetical protein
MTDTTGTPLYDRMIAFNYEDDERGALMSKVWDGHRWMVDVYTGGHRDDREHDMLRWCYETFGDQASPIHGKPGTWQRGNATVCGWTWFGFSIEVDMDRFVAQWPAPEDVKHPQELVREVERS